MVKRRDERLTVDEKIDTGFNGCDLSLGKHGSASQLRLFLFVLFRQGCGSMGLVSDDGDVQVEEHRDVGRVNVQGPSPTFLRKSS